MYKEVMEYRYSTEEYHPNNMFTMTDYLENHLGEEFSVIFQDESYAELRCNQTLNVWRVTAQGDGDSFNHLIILEKYE